MSPDSPRFWHLVDSTARSFALTLRWLPAAIRESVALAYLLARYSDTGADGAQTAGERELLACGAELTAMLESSPDRDLIEAVWGTIRAGQRFDLERFRPGSTPLSARELDEYTYMVAGCVGEFWTMICSRHIPDFSRKPGHQMLAWGVDYGKGLQRINIIRDRKKDARAGRVYLPGERLHGEVGLLNRQLASGEKYVRALRRGRLRIATALPLLLARATLRKWGDSPDSEHTKISRLTVYALLIRALTY